MWLAAEQHQLRAYLGSVVYSVYLKLLFWPDYWREVELWRKRLLYWRKTRRQQRLRPCWPVQLPFRPRTWPPWTASFCAWLPISSACRRPFCRCLRTGWRGRPEWSSSIQWWAPCWRRDLLGTGRYTPLRPSRGSRWSVPSQRWIWRRARLGWSTLLPPWFDTNRFHLIRIVIILIPSSISLCVLFI